jgi:hypothetical protein
MAVAAATIFALALLLPGVLATTPGPDPGPRAGAVTADPTASARVSAPSSPNVVAGTSPQPTEQAGDPTLPPTRARTPGRLETAAQRLAVWEDPFGAVRAEVVVTVRNTGGSPVEVALSTATWTVSDEAGQPVASGRFAHAFPAVVEPGGEAYLIDGVSAAFAEANELATLEVDVQGEPAGHADAPVELEVADVEWTQTDEGGVVASARVENPSTEPVSEVSAAVLIRDGSGEIVAAVYDVAIGSLGPGESRTFDTAYPGTPPVDPDSVASAEGVATGDRGGTVEAE